MTTAPPARRTPVGPAIALMLVPTALAVGLLMLGLTTATLAFVYVSIAASLIALPAFVVGVVMLVRR